MIANFTKMITLVLASFMLIAIFSESAIAQSCTPLNEDFGSAGATCPGEVDTESPYIVNHCDNNTVNCAKSATAIDDGEYVLACDGTNFNCGWYGGCSTPMSDHTAGTDAGLLAMINAGSGPREFYHRTVTGLCSGAQYAFSFWAANVSTYTAGNSYDCNYGLNPVNLTAYTFAAGTAVQSCTPTSASCTFSTATATRTLRNTTPINCQSSFTWTQYTANFTATATEATNGLDLVFVTAAGGGNGADFVIDDIKITYTSGCAGGCTAPTPVTFISFTAEKAPQNITLRWSTATEKNNDYFTVERSADGIHFEQIGTVKGKGTSNEANYYTFGDYSFLNGNVYYRLRQVDFDGKYEFSPVAYVNMDVTNQVIITNDPSSSQALISFFKEGEATFTITDMLGRVVYSGERASDEPSIAINKSMICCGFYIVKVQIGSEVISKKIVLN